MKIPAELSTNAFAHPCTLFSLTRGCRNCPTNSQRDGGARGAVVQWLVCTTAASRIAPRIAPRIAFRIAFRICSVLCLHILCELCAWLCHQGRAGRGTNGTGPHSVRPPADGLQLACVDRQPRGGWWLDANPHLPFATAALAATTILATDAAVNAAITHAATNDPIRLVLRSCMCVCCCGSCSYLFSRSHHGVLGVG